MKVEVVFRIGVLVTNGVSNRLRLSHGSQGMSYTRYYYHSGTLG